MTIGDYKSLEEIDLSFIDYGDIDDRIKNLVRAMRFLRFPFSSDITQASCEGHLDGERHHYPWIGLRPFGHLKEREVLEHVIHRYNKSHEIKWKVDVNDTLVPWIDNYEEVSKKRLKQLQQSAGKLAKFIFDYRYEISTFYKEDIEKAILTYRSICETFGNSPLDVESLKFLEAVKSNKPNNL